MRRFHNILTIDSMLADSIDYSNFNPASLIPVLEEVINIEKTTREANKLIHDEIAYLSAEYRITQAEILLCLLRRHSSLYSGTS